MASDSLFPLPPAGGAAGGRLARALKALRRKRGLRPPDVARLMGMPLRSYEHFEAGQGRLNFEKVRRFAEATDTDPLAILAAVTIGSPDFAVRAAENKLMLIMMMALQDFDASAGDAIARLEPRTLIRVFERTFTELALEAQRSEPVLAEWLARRRGPGEPPPDAE